jgi:hypothetical protein
VISDQGSGALNLTVETNTLELKGIAASDVTVTRSPDPSAHDLILMIAGQSPIVLKDQTVASTANVIKRVVFDDGTVWDAADLLLQADGGIPATPNGVTARVFDGSVNSLSGTSSDDTYFWGAGHGNGTIVEGNYLPWQKADSVRLVGLNAADVDLGIRQENSHVDLAIIDKATGETLTVVGQFDSATADGSNSWAGGGTGIERLVFADGTVWNTQQILDHSSYMAAPGSTSVSNLDLDDGTLPIEAAPGTTLIGLGDKPNTYLWHPGDGDVSIQHNGWQNGLTDTLRLQGVSAANLQFVYASSDLLIRDQATGETVKVLGQLPYYAAGNGIEHIALDDGTVLDLTHTIFFNRGSGTPSLYLYGAVGTVAFGAGIAAQDVYFQTDGFGTLTIGIKGDPSDSIHLNNDLTQKSWGLSSIVQQLTFSDGTVLSVGQPVAGQGQPLSFTWFDNSPSSMIYGSNLGSNVFELQSANINVGFASPGIDGGTNVVDYSTAIGHSEITANGGSGLIKFDNGISSSDVYLQANSYGDLIVKFRNDDTDSITIHNDLSQQSWGVSSAIQQLQFGDGTAVNLGQPAAGQGAPLTFNWIGSASATSLAGSNFGSNIFEVAPGGDSITFGNGNNTVDFGTGDGHAEVSLNGGTGVVNLNALPTAVLLGTSGSDLVISLGSGADTLTIQNEFSSANGITAIKFADGTVWDRATIAANAPIRGTPGNDYINAPANGATIDPGLGDDTVNLTGTGADVIEFAKGDGHDTLDNGGSGYQRNDTLDLTNILPSEVQLSRTDSKLIMSVPSTGDSVTVLYQFYNGGSSVYGINNIKFADGTVWDRTTIAANAPIRGTSGNDYINAPTDGVTIIPGTGDDTVNLTGTGADIIEFAKGDGHDTLDNGGSGYQRNDTLDLTNILPSEVQLSRTDSKLIMSVPSTGDSVTVLYQFYNGGSSVYGINNIKFADGTVWDRTTITANAPIRGTSGNDYINAPTDGVTIIPGTGDDTVNLTGTGADVIEFAKGDGHDTLDNGGSGYQRNDTLDLTNILPSEVQLTRSDNKLIVRVPSTGDSVTVLYQFYNGGSSVYGINQIKFADGTVWDRATITANAPIRGAGGNDYINLPSDGVTVDAGAGDDTFAVSGNGSDRILFAKGDGHDTLTNPGSGYNRNDTLVLTDLNASDVQFSRNGVALVLNVPSTGDSFTSSFQFWGDGSQIQGLTHIQFADGTIWDRSAIAASVQTFTWTGSAVNASLNGDNYGSNIFQIGGGAETANGGARNNIYQVSPATGQATINLPSSSTSHNEVDFLGGITDQNLWFMQSGNDLKIDLLGTTTSATVDGWFSGQSSEMQEITAGGLKIDSQISQLVQAMATYAANNPGFDPASSTLNTVPNEAGLQSAITAAWHA